MEIVELCGFVFTPDDWEVLDEAERWELLSAGTEPEAPVDDHATFT